MTKKELEDLEDDVTILEGGTPRPHHNTLRIDELRVLQDRVEELVDGGDGFDITLTYSLAEGYESRQLYGLIIANDNVELVEDKWEFDNDIQAYTPLGDIKFTVSNGANSVELSGKDLCIYFDGSISNAWVLNVNYGSYTQEMQDFFDMMTNNYNSVLGLSYTLSSEEGILKIRDQLNKAKTITWQYGNAIDSDHDYPVDITLNLYDTTAFTKYDQELSDSRGKYYVYTASSVISEMLYNLLPDPTEAGEFIEVLLRFYKDLDNYPYLHIADNNMGKGRLSSLNDIGAEIQFDSAGVATIKDYTELFIES